uniref:AlNc14C18G1910 protein n=1 Tax=Albugo laibachii Nc14 TaxID=890382 RepID=F0W4U0_9STRA|nr:AlNc14C18G1910 [Albugo laibachii Nc14]|eukprot:CCA16128.1 AlNc14C18G1910 [Albugo laibachii Nc14]
MERNRAQSRAIKAMMEILKYENKKKSVWMAAILFIDDRRLDFKRGLLSDHQLLAFKELFITRNQFNLALYINDGKILICNQARKSCEA